ncbi:MAG: hypothetical protein HQ565_10065 [Bacteroidetes bacterium]|nr:hypothetical protein [Bacteroidota bacterium]
MNKNRSQQLLLEVYKYLKQRDFENFQVDLPNLERPKKIVEERTNKIYQPDMTATHNGSLCIFELISYEIPKEEKDSCLKKWRVLSRYAASKEGKLYLIVPVEQFEQINSLINTHNLENIGILQFQGH